jgi:tRNA-dihydrouridine synthase A
MPESVHGDLQPLLLYEIVKNNQSHKFCIAPMMEWTDRHCRMFHRQLSGRARLYTEMVTAQAAIRGDRTKLLGFDPAEQPVALQLGGSEPAALAEAAKIGADFGYDEINLNVGCPSDRVQSGKFGACLMLEPDLVADCVAAMQAKVAIPVTVKCRIGVDDQDPEIALRVMIAKCKAAGCTIFVVHARKALLQGLSPRENRDVPPLDYDLVYQIKRENPELTIILNGGLTTLEACEECLTHLDGVMLGRAAYQSPNLLADVDARFFGDPARSVDAAVEAFVAYVAQKRSDGVPLNAMTRHILGVFHGRPGARQFRRYLSENATRYDAGVEVLRDAIARVGTREIECVAPDPVTV